MADLESIVDVYRWVIEDVSSKLQPEFENAGVALHVLSLIKQQWTELMELNMREQQNPIQQKSYLLPVTSIKNAPRNRVNNTNSAQLKDDPLSYTVTVPSQGYINIPQSSFININPQIHTQHSHYMKTLNSNIFSNNNSNNNMHSVVNNLPEKFIADGNPKSSSINDFVPDLVKQNSSKKDGPERESDGEDDDSSLDDEPRIDPSTWTNVGFCLYNCVRGRYINRKRNTIL